MKREAKFTILFRHYLKAHPLPVACALELKQTTTYRLPFSTVKPHQMDALLAAWSYMGILHKISDEGRGFKPFDMVYLKNVAACIVIKYPAFFCIIPADQFAKEARESKRKSLTSERAREIATVVVELNKNGDILKA